MEKNIFLVYPQLWFNMISTDKPSWILTADEKIAKSLSLKRTGPNLVIKREITISLAGPNKTYVQEESGYISENLMLSSNFEMKKIGLKDYMYYEGYCTSLEMAQFLYPERIESAINSEVSKIIEYWKRKN